MVEAVPVPNNSAQDRMFKSLGAMNTVFSFLPL